MKEYRLIAPLFVFACITGCLVPDRPARPGSAKLSQEPSSPAATPSSSSAPFPTENADALRNFAIYYSWPSSVNSADLAWNINSVIDFFRKYHSVVFGAGLELSSHPDHSNTIQIISGLVQGPTPVSVYGYVTLGMTSARYNTLQLTSHIDDWKAMGATGIFFDEAGFDYGIQDGPDRPELAMRKRQVLAAQLCHDRGMRTFFNAWNPRDLGNVNSGTGGGVGSGGVDLPTPALNASDLVLYESFLITTGARETFQQHQDKVNGFLQLRRDFGVSIYAINTTNNASSTYVSSDLNAMALAARIYGFQGVAWGTAQFSASGVDNSVMPYRSFSSDIATQLWSSPIRWALERSEVQRDFVFPRTGTATVKYSPLGFAY